MPERNIGLEILEGLREIKARKAGWKARRTRTLRRPAPAGAIRGRLRLSQAAFAGLMGVSIRTVQDWEQGRRGPSGPAEALLRIAEQLPKSSSASPECPARRPTRPPRKPAARGVHSHPG